MKKSKPMSNDQPDTTRRSFMWKAGAAVSAVFASVVPVMAKSGGKNDRDLKGRLNDLSSRLSILEDNNNVQRLYRDYENYLDSGMYKEVVKLFADDGEVVFNGGLFKGKKSGVTRLYCDKFGQGMTGKKLKPTLVQTSGRHQSVDSVTVAGDRKTAEAQFFYTMQVGTPMISGSSFVEMSCLQGGGVIKWCEEGICEMSCVRDLISGTWKIRRIEYKVSSKTDYRPGKYSVKSVSVPLYSRIYPDDPAGPDKLIGTVHGNREA